MPKVLVVLDDESYRVLEQLAESDDRVVEQEARFLLRRAIGGARPQPEQVDERTAGGGG